MFNLCPRPVEYEDGETESQGKLILYNRAELKTSDHRQVLAYVGGNLSNVHWTFVVFKCQYKYLIET